MWLVPPEHWGDDGAPGDRRAARHRRRARALRRGSGWLDDRRDASDVRPGRRAARSPAEIRERLARRDPHRAARARRPAAGRAGAVRGVRRRPHVGPRGDPGARHRRLPRTPRQPLGRRRAPARACDFDRRRPQGARPPAVRGAPGHRAGRSPSWPRRGRPTTSAPRSPSSPAQDHARPRRVPRPRPPVPRRARQRRAATRCSPRSTPRLLDALFGSGEFASLLYAEVNRAEVDEHHRSSAVGAHRAIADGRRQGRPARRRGGGRCATSTTSSAAWWSGCCERRREDLTRDQYCYFFDDDAFDETDRPGFRRRVIIGDDLSCGSGGSTGGADGLVPAPPRRTTSSSASSCAARSTSASARPRTTTRTVLDAGDVYLAPRSVWHGDSDLHRRRRVRRGAGSSTCSHRRATTCGATADAATADWRLAVDIGGTFTDVVLLDAASGRVVVDKTLTTPAAPLDGVRARRAPAARQGRRRGRPTSRRRSCTPRRSSRTR